ncbi:unnamed protein product [Phaedon cochleariae]|uniref:Mpv17-like protein n=1 Tax=Phaedon cochleariae TaxID=80249 RepID=A0A9P0GT59_PHACE|nr:unnamed protein product [Phaedon cochleariae]
MNNFRNFLKRSLERYPIVTNSLIYGTLCSASEFSQQTLSCWGDRQEPYNSSAIGRYVIYGTFIGGPLIANWYRTLDRWFPGKTSSIIVKKLMIDQFTFTPALLAIFYVSMSIMEQKADLFEEMKQKFVPTFKTSCMFWMPAQTMNFLLIPPMYRVSYIAMCSFAWINILCFIKRKN